MPPSLRSLTATYSVTDSSALSVNKEDTSWAGRAATGLQLGERGSWRLREQQIAQHTTRCTCFGKPRVDRKGHEDSRLHVQRGTGAGLVGKTTLEQDEGCEELNPVGI